MKKNKSLAMGIIFTVLFVVFTVLVKCVDVQQIGPADTSVGFATINGIFFNLVGADMNASLYKLTDILGYLAILFGLLFALVGLVQLIKRKSLFKVDREIITLGLLYVVLAIVYVIFEKVVINYRPVIMLGETVPEASYPSSHTMLATTVLGSIIIIVKSYIKNINVRKIIQCLALVMAVIIVVGRLMSGVHWLTDIIGGLIISIALISFYNAFSKDNSGK